MVAAAAEDDGERPRLGVHRRAQRNVGGGAAEVLGDDDEAARLRRHRGAQRAQVDVLNSDLDPVALPAQRGVGRLPPARLAAARLRRLVEQHELIGGGGAGDAARQLERELAVARAHLDYTRRAAENAKVGKD